MRMSTGAFTSCTLTWLACTLTRPWVHGVPISIVAGSRILAGSRAGRPAEVGMRDAVITGGARTAVGRLLGSLNGFTGADLGGIAIKAALDRAGLTGDQVEYVIMGQVLQAGAGQVPARQAAVAGGIPMTVPATTINKACLSGLDAI